MWVAGLDSLSSLQLSKYLRKLAKDHHKTVITTVHQPSADMLRQWDKLVLVANDGHVAYEGPIFDVLDHFSKLGFQVTNDLHKDNPVEFALELLGEDDTSNVLIAAWVDRVKQDASSATVKTPLSSAQGHPPDISSVVKVTSREVLPFHWQLLVLVQRQVLYNTLMLHGIKGKVLSNLFAGFLYGVIYHNNGDKLWDLKVLYDPTDLTLSPWCYNIAAMCFSVPLYVILVNGPPIPQMFYMKRYCDKEQGMGLYSAFARWLSITLVDVPLVFFGTCIFILIVYKMIGLEQPWFHFALCVMLPSLIGYSQSQFCAQVSSSAINGFILFAIISAYEITFTGFLISKDSLQPHIRWMVYSTYTRWSTGQLMYNEFHDLLGKQGKLFLDLYNYENMEFWRSRDVLFAFLLGFQLLIFLSVIPWGGELKRVKDADTDHVPPSTIAEERDNTAKEMDLEAATSTGRNTSSTTSSAKKNTMDMRSLLSNGEFAMNIEVECQPEDSSGRVSKPVVELDVYDDISPLPAYKQVTFAFHNIGYVVSGGKVLVQNVDGFVCPGELTCVMGSTGSGKTTLLNVLSGRANAGTLRGQILANDAPFLGMKLGNSIASDTAPSYAYVMQDDVHCPLLTVRETLEFAAMLRRREGDVSMVSETVNDIMGILGLKGVAACYVGAVGNSALSRGQIRRLTVGVEIVLSPSMIFLDEPTTGRTNLSLLWLWRLLCWLL